MEVTKQLFAALLFMMSSSAEAIQTYYMDQHCGETIYIGTTAQIRFRTTRFFDYRSSWKCSMSISTYSYRFMIQFRDLDMEYGSSSCPRDWLSIYEHYPVTNTPIGRTRFCGTITPSQIYTSINPHVYFRFETDGSVQKDGFDIYLTQFHTGVCSSYSEHECDNGRCINKTLVCNGYNPCGDHSDCHSSSYLKKSAVAAEVIGAIIGLVVLIAICVVVGRLFYNCMRTPNSRRRTLFFIGRTQPAVTTTVVAHVPPPQQPLQQPQPPPYQQPYYPPSYNTPAQQGPPQPAMYPVQGPPVNYYPPQNVPSGDQPPPT